VSIEEMPIYNWIKILETADLKWIFKESKGRVTKRLGEHWLTLQQQYIDEFDLDENYKQQLRIMKKLALLNCDFSITRDRALLNDIKMLEIDLESNNQKKAIKFYEMLDHVEKYKGFAIDPQKTSVMKWYYSLKNMSGGKAD
jgi:hypothetical protein